MKKFEYANESKKFWDHSYKVYLSEFNNVLINANNKQDALDFAIDHAEENGWEGLFLTDEEITEKEEEGFINDYITGGNHGKTLSSLYVSIEKLD